MRKRPPGVRATLRVLLDRLKGHTAAATHVYRFTVRILTFPQHRHTTRAAAASTEAWLRRRTMVESLSRPRGSKSKTTSGVICFLRRALKITGFNIMDDMFTKEKIAKKAR